MTTKRTGPSAQRVTSLGSVAELERTGSKGSINFSRPISSPNSPPTSPMNDRRATTLSSGQPNSRPATTTMSPGEVRYIQQSLNGATNQPVNKKNVTTGEGRQGGNSPAQLNQGQPMDNGVASVSKKTKKRIVSGRDSDESKPLGFTTSYGSDSDATTEHTAPSERPPTFNTRAALLLSKQPSIVREDREAEEREERSGAGLGKVRPDLTANNGLKANGKKSPLPANSTPQQHNRSSSQPAPTLATTHLGPTTRKLSGSNATPARGNDNIRGGRHQSLSPARAAHFSVQPILKTPNGVRHQPPPRSISPAKSAMKSSPSPRATSPSGGGHAPSETSDTVSMLSEDGIRSRKKKNRVSFDDDAVVVVPGRAASTPTTSDSQNKGGTTRSWFGMGHGKKQADFPATSQVQEDDAVIQPTPALPSFGSIRGHKEREGTGASNEPSSPSVEPHHTMASWAQETLARIDLSSDQAVGAVLSQDFATKPTASPLPPHVTSIEGTGYGSDSEGSVYSTDNVERAGANSGANEAFSEAHAAPYRELASPTHGDEGDYQYNSKDVNEAVPSIAVLPATPAEDALRGAEWVGDSPITTDSRDAKKQSHGVIEHHPTDPTPATIGIAEPEPEGVLASREPVTPVVGGVAEALRTQTEHEDDEEDTGESIYSDAAEDLSDLEGDGFGSINAIVESPIVDSFGIAITTPPDSPSGRLGAPISGKKSKLSRLASDDSQPGTEEGWDKAQAYWSGLSESRKKQIERAATQESVDEGSTQAQPKPKKKTNAAKKDPEQDQPLLPPYPDRQYVERTTRSKSPRMTEMKQSMRDGSGTTAESPHMRKSMRTGDTLKPAIGQTPQNRSMETTTPQEPRGTLQKKYRPVSAVPLVNYNTPSYGTTPSHTRNASGGSVPASATPLTPREVKKKSTPAVKPRQIKSDDSDSESSFRKMRPSTSDSGRYTMRRSMRGPPAEQPQLPTTSRAGPLGVRTSSPSGSTARRPFSSGGYGMKTSLRGSGESGARPERTKSPIRGFGFGRGSKGKDQKAPSKSRSQFSSKFGNSSDHDDGPSTFRSRFDDSSDEDLPSKRPSNLAPVRGIPRRVDEGDSTDLDDSSEDEKRSKRRNMPSKTKTTKPEGTALAAGSLRRSGSGQDLTKFSEMGTGLQAKKAAEKDPKRRSFFGLGRKKDDSKVKKPDLPPPASRDGTPQRNNVLPPGSPTSPKSPKLQRRNTPMRLDSNSWPLPPVPGAANDRPNTADGVRNTARPDLGVRSSTVDTSGSKRVDQNGVVLGRTGKKKRFPMLRKVFGLHD